MATQLRCEGTMFGILSDDRQTLEVKCKRRSCGAEKGSVILHTISLDTGQVVKTERFAEPRLRKET